MTIADFDPVEIPDELREKLGLPDPGTRIFRAYGPSEAMEVWWDAVCEVCGQEGAVSPGGVSAFCKVTRAGVHKRLKEGRLTAFCFHEERVTRSRFRKRERIETQGMPLTYIPVKECKRWGNQLRDLDYWDRKSIRIGDGDYSGQFLIVDKPKRRKEDT